MTSITPSSTPFTQVVDGFPIPGMFSVETYRSALNYKPRPDDLFIATYPKCGTTWAQNILALIFNQGVPLTDALNFRSTIPFLEMSGAEGVELTPRPVAIKVHLPYHLTPRCETAKYIYVTRNPKDCCVSYFHHMRNLPVHGFNGTFEEFFEFFISGNIDYGDYFDHLLGWYAHRNDPNVLLLTYEEMKEHPEKSVLKMASFIDDKLYAEPLRNDPVILENILKYSSIDYMRQNFNKAMEEVFTMSQEDVLKSELPESMKKMMLNLLASSGPENSPPKCEFIRKGIIGDWKNHFTEEQSKRLEEKFEEKTKGTDIPKLWEKYM